MHLKNLPEKPVVKLPVQLPTHQPEAERKLVLPSKR
jgi:hypothetical protein